MEKYYAALLIIISNLAACSPAPVLQATAGSPIKHPLETTRPTPATTPSGLPTKEASLGPLANEPCLVAGGRIEQHTLDSASLEGELTFRVYTPPCYQKHADERYPVLYLIHGQTYNDDQWDRLGADEVADELIASGDKPPFLIIMPADASHYTQPAANNFDEAVVDELIPWVDETYRTLADREHRAVGGLSRGASWAIHLALTHPELFAALGGHSPPIFQEDASRLRGWLDAIPAAMMPRVWLDVGNRDQRAILDSAMWFEGLLNERDLTHEWHLLNGDHSEEYWSGRIELYLRWYAQNW